MQITPGSLSGLLIIQPKAYQDSRGHFFETFQQKRYEEIGIPPFVQDNFSRSTRNVLRGLHFQLPQPQGKLVFVTRGSVWDVAVDIRKTSPTFGLWFGMILNDENHTQIYIPPGFAHGFCVLSDEADFHYKCTDYYFPGAEQGIAWNDAKLNIPWPVQNPILSPKDEMLLCLHEHPDETLFP